MHHHAELVIPPTDDIRASVEALMKPFSEDNEEGYPGFWDWYVIGGRYSGSKIEAAVGESRLKAFYERLSAEKITVSGFTAGKQRLQPESQVALVDGLWSKEFPEFSGPCPLFDHYNDQYDRAKQVLPVDVCTVDAMPKELTCATLMIAGPDKGDHAREMLHTSIWNGATFQETKFTGKVSDGLEFQRVKLESYKKEYAERALVKGDWLIVTVDFHS